MFAEHLALLDDLLAVGDVHYPAVVVGEVLHHPRHLRRPDPLPGISQLLLAAQVYPVDQLLDLGDCQHPGQSEVVLEGHPGKQGLQTAVGAAPAVVVE
jgi:hypothetical protein